MLGLALGASLTIGQAGVVATETRQKGAAMTVQARGTFEAKVEQLPNDEKVKGLVVGRLAVTKQFKGDLEGASLVEMMSADTSVQGSAGYVAIEKVTGTLKGRAGTFLLLHQGTMKQGADFKLSVVVVPDSGSGQLTGLSGAMTIIIAGGTHSYELDYTLPAVP